ncbi:MAG: hypothetical protein IKI40_10000, partial [Treponema sp.]|nr:hypothetical protein [Treponema sp.]
LSGKIRQITRPTQKTGLKLHFSKICPAPSRGFFILQIRGNFPLISANFPIAQNDYKVRGKA